MSESTLPRSAEKKDFLAGNLSTGLLKLIALVFMFVDHSGKVLFSNMQEMRILGRIAFPIYIWCMIVGLHRTRSVPKYLLRIFLVGLISQPLYVLALDSQGHISRILENLLQPFQSIASSTDAWNAVWQLLQSVFVKKPNIFLTLLVGLAALWGIREKKFYSHLWAPVAAIILATVLEVDYGWKGVLLFMLMYAARSSRSALAAVMIAFFLYWGTFYKVTPSLFGITLDFTSWPAYLATPVQAFLHMETYALLSLPFILIRMPRDIRMPRWLGYALYPAHLVLLIVLKVLVFGW